MVLETANYSPPDYSTVSNSNLQKVLTSYEEIIRDSPQSVRASEYYCEIYSRCGIQFISQAKRVADRLRRMGIVPAVQDAVSKYGFVNTHYIFGPWQRRAIAAFCWTCSVLPLDSTDIGKDFPQRVDLLKEALGDHPLAKYIHGQKKILGETAPVNVRVIEFPDGSTISVDTLQTRLEGRRSDEKINLSALSLTEAQLEMLIRMAARKPVTVIPGEVSVDRLRACLKMLLES